MAKVDVNGDERHPLFAGLSAFSDGDGYSGDIRWNFEKFLISPSGEVLRFTPLQKPNAPELIAAIEDVLATRAPADA
jgi:glutathione peroxidase